jgi:hypothetical protein
LNQDAQDTVANATASRDTWCTAMNQLGFVRPLDGLRQSVVIAVATAADAAPIRRCSRGRPCASADIGWSFQQATISGAVAWSCSTYRGN